MTLRFRFLFTLLPLLFSFVAGLAWLHTHTTDDPETRQMIYLSSSVALVAILLLVFIVAKRASRPIETLKDEALRIAAGDYGHPISVKGPKEVVELANTLNTMRECLQDHINRLRIHTQMLERRYGEYECAVLLQNHMLQKTIDEFYHSKVSIQLVRGGSARSVYGFRFETFEEDRKLRLQIQEAKEPGFLGTYELLTNPQEGTPFLSLDLDLHTHSVDFNNEGMPVPLLFSKEERRIQPLGGKVRAGDHLFISNRSFLKLFSNQDRLEQILSRTMRHFGDEGQEVWQKILRNELTFLSSRNRLEEDLFIICISFQG